MRWRMRVVAVVAAAGLSASAHAAGTRLRAPLVRFGSGEGARLVLVDRSGSGARVRIVLADPSGRDLVQQDRSFSINRAIPPGETIEVLLDRLWREPFTGSLRVESTRPIEADYRGATLQYRLVEGAGGTDFAFAMATGHDSYLLAVQNAGASEVPVDVSVRDPAGSRPLRTLRLPPEGSVALALPPPRLDGEILVVTATAPVVLRCFVEDRGVLRTIEAAGAR
jgi:hypothetical protein